MTQLTTSSLLLFTASLLSIELIFFGWFLARRGMLNWVSAGFWSWASFWLYFVSNPLLSVLTNNIYEYNMRLQITGGTERALWILLLTALGIGAFFCTYFLTAIEPMQEKPISAVHLSPPAQLVLLGSAFFGIYSLLVFRAGVVDIQGEKLIQQGRFVGDVTGYQNSGYMLLFVPIILMLLHPSQRLRMAGWLAAAGFIGLSLPHGWSRYATLSLLIALTITTTLNSRKRWPHPLLMVGVLLAGVLYQMRSHAAWEYGQISNEISYLMTQLPTQLANVFADNDTRMLASWYVTSYLNEHWIGYDYGLTLLNYGLTGWIPSRIFPQKYFLVDWLNAQRHYTYPVIFEALLYGKKSSLFGSFYQHGGWIGLLIGSSMVGYLFRRIDGMLLSHTHVLVKATAIAWLSTLWMIWGSTTTWGLIRVGILAMPALGAWVISAKRSQPMRRFKDTKTERQLLKGIYPNRAGAQQKPVLHT